MKRYNKFYVNIGSNLFKKIPHVERHPTSYIKQTNPMSIFLNEVDDNELTRIIYKLSNSSPGWDGICAEVVKNTFLTYIKPLVHVLNLSLSQGVPSN